MAQGGSTRREFIETAAAVSIAAQTSATQTSPEFHEFYLGRLRRNGIVGSSFLLLRQNAPVVKEFYGYSDAATKKLVDWNTCYHWASITKTFTGIAILQLRDRSRLNLDDPVAQFIPELRQVHDPYGPVDTITIRHLLTHSAGFRNPTWPWRTETWQPFEPAKWSQIVAMLPYTKVEFKPGGRHSYSNLGIVFLGQIIERLTDDPYKVYIDKNILKPLAMEASYFDQAPYYLLPFRSHSYFLEKGKLKEAKFNFDTGITVSNGGLMAPFGDMQKYLEFLLGKPEKNVYETVLKRSTLAEMFQKQLDVLASDSSQLAGMRGSDSIGLAFFRHEEGGRVYIGHGGNQNGFLSHFYVDPSSGRAYLVAYNTDASDPEQNTSKLDLEIRDYLFKRNLEIR
ncbi:MAG: beta-lactamase family protein [Acidobacteriaceae bacterium]|nr:beta-lactamase family protein [Acidobacteriaceae bacterium]MBV9782110.1 beta-lactamase family protein [Acidobacteriaceae bacterium]